MFRNLFDGWHIIVLAIVILLLFGWKKMPDMARSFGRSARILKSEVDGMKEDSKSQAAGQTVKGQAATPPQPPTPAAPAAAAPTPAAPAAAAAAPHATNTTPADATPISDTPVSATPQTDPVDHHPSV